MLQSCQYPCLSGISGTGLIWLFSHYQAPTKGGKWSTLLYFSCHSTDCPRSCRLWNIGEKQIVICLSGILSWFWFWFAVVVDMFVHLVGMFLSLFSFLFFFAWIFFFFFLDEGLGFGFFVVCFVVYFVDFTWLFPSCFTYSSALSRFLKQ